MEQLFLKNFSSRTCTLGGKKGCTKKENISVVDEHNKFNSQPKVDTEEQIKFFIVSQDTNLLSDLAKKVSRILA